ncbi:MAG: hypothetical protein AB7O62_16570 [Pirellulales bacterium]
MERQSLSRRDFNRLSSAALGGLLAGGVAGCNNSTPPPANPGPDGGASNASGGDNGAGAGDVDLTQNFLMDDLHVCRGLNTCKGKDKEQDNDCAGQGDCATFENTCSQANTCAGKGGCGETPGFNACGGQGGCHVPLMSSAWTKAREVFEARMTAAGKKFGEAPAKKRAVPKEDPVDEAPSDDIPPDDADDTPEDADSLDDSE